MLPPFISLLLLHVTDFLLNLHVHSFHPYLHHKFISTNTSSTFELDLVLNQNQKGYFFNQEHKKAKFFNRQHKKDVQLLEWVQGKSRWCSEGWSPSAMGTGWELGLYRLAKRRLQETPCGLPILKRSSQEGGWLATWAGGTRFKQKDLD